MVRPNSIDSQRLDDEESQRAKHGDVKGKAQQFPFTFRVYSLSLPCRPRLESARFTHAVEATGSAGECGSSRAFLDHHMASAVGPERSAPPSQTESRRVGSVGVSMTNG